MCEYEISGINVKFPFEPYDLQRSYMAKVIECLENSVNGVLESPTGTGKTLSLLCSSLAWLTKRKMEIDKSLHQQQQQQKHQQQEKSTNYSADCDFDDLFQSVLSQQKFSTKIIYSSRTHSQIAQAMKELKASGYNNVKAAVIGSRDQLCINADVLKEKTNSNKIHLCKIKVTTRSCSFYNKVESTKDNPKFRDTNILDIEELVSVGRKLRCCPFFVSKNLLDDADIVFMPYNYLLDPMIRKANNIQLTNNIVIIDEAHNVENVCEDSASIQFTSSDIAVCIDDVTFIMKSMNEGSAFDTGEVNKDFTMDDLVLLKEILLKFEKTIDDIEMPIKKSDGITYPGSYIFDLLLKSDIKGSNAQIIRRLIDNIIQYLIALSAQNEFFRRGGGLQKFSDFLAIIFADLSEQYKAKLGQCYKMFIEIEQQTKAKTGATISADGWIQPKVVQTQKSSPKILNYWCFNPGFSMQHLLTQNVRSVILTSGTLAPLKPYISELGIPISVRLENPHIISPNQICVKVIGEGCDREPLLCNFSNRDNPKYILSLGRTILSLCPVIPHGLLVFFTSYSLLNKCKDMWQMNGIWSQINQIKPIFVEPKTKDAFIETINDYYANIKNPTVNGAMLMGVCRGKVSEGLDFADINGRAVIIVGLPFPPLMDQRVILKKKYLEENRTTNNELLSGDEWYHLEATRAVNQAIGRIIRHRNDYGAILFFDLRFNQHNQQAQLSSWVRQHLIGQQQKRNGSIAPKISFGGNYGEITRFFRNVVKIVPPNSLKTIADDNNRKSETHQFANIPSQSTSKCPDIKEEMHQYERSTNNPSNVDMSIYTAGCQSITTKPQTKNDGFLSRLNNTATTVDFNSVPYEPENNNLSLSSKRNRMENDVPLAGSSKSSGSIKKRKFFMVPNEQIKMPENIKDILKLVKNSLSEPNYAKFIKSMTAYQAKANIEDLLHEFSQIFQEPCFHYIFKGFRRFIRDIHYPIFDEAVKKL